MQTFEAILKRKSVRNFKSEQLPENILNKILNAACVSPVGHGDYNSLRLTVIQNREFLDKISFEVTQSKGQDIFYGAPTVIVISSNEAAPLNYSNAGCISENMLLAATDLEISSVYVIQIIGAFKKNPDLIKNLNIPNDYFPISSVALGYSAQNVQFKTQFTRNIQINRV